MKEVNISKNLEDVRERIKAAAEASGRHAEDITLVAVTKTHPPEMMNEAIIAGATDIGENKPQEVRDKFSGVLPVKWHLIGHLQTNKIKYIIDKVCLIHSVDSVKLMDAIDEQAEKHGLIMDILIQVNISGEETKFGIKPEELDSMLRHAGELSHIKVKGLMTIAPKIDENQSNSVHFDRMYQLYLDIRSKKYDNVIMDYLSMGMSGDFEAAIRAGANMVRVGSAIFGARDYSKRN